MKDGSGTWSVYIIQEAGTGHIKIGYGKDVKDRLKGCQVGNCRNLSIIYEEEFEDKRKAIKAEYCLHQYFNPYLIAGEWFGYDSLHKETIKIIKEQGIMEFYKNHNSIPESRLSDEYKKTFSQLHYLIEQDFELSNNARLVLLHISLLKIIKDVRLRIDGIDNTGFRRTRFVGSVTSVT